MLSDTQLNRYSRQILLADVDIIGQEKLLHSRVLIVGAGGLGSSVALFLAGAGVGHLWLFDDDTVDLSNLHRQILHNTQRLQSFKVTSAQQTLQSLNPDVAVEAIAQRVTGPLLQAHLPAVDLLIDCSDNSATRRLINAACLQHRTPWIFASAIGFDGQISVFDPTNIESPCYACLYPEGIESTESCNESGVLGPITGIMGSLQALEAIKYLTASGQLLMGRVLFLDGRRLQWREMQLSKKKTCSQCNRAHLA